MTTPWNVLARLRQLTDIDGSEAEKILPLCVINLERIFAKLSEKADKDDVRITHAAAALTYYDYALKFTAKQDNITSFKAGDITVSQSAQSLTEEAEKIKTSALIEIAPLLKDTSFVFMNV